MAEASRRQPVRRHPTEEVRVSVAREEPVDDIGTDVLAAAVGSVREQEVEQHAQIGSCGEQPRMAGDASIRIPGISVVRLPIEHVLAPPIPRCWIAAIPIAEGGIVHHVSLITVSLLRCREVREATRFRQVGGGAQTKWSVTRIANEALKWLSSD